MAETEKVDDLKLAELDVKESDFGNVENIVLDPKKEKKLLMKLDLAFVPIIMVTYLSCFLDRTNIGMLLGYLEPYSNG